MTGPAARTERQLDGCLLQANISFPQDDVLVCGQCPNRSDMRGNLGPVCATARKVNS